MLVVDAFLFKNSLSALLVYEQQASQKWYLSSRHLISYDNYKNNIYIYIYIYIYQNTNSVNIENIENIIENIESV